MITSRSFDATLYYSISYNNYKLTKESVFHNIDQEGKNLQI